MATRLGGRPGAMARARRVIPGPARPADATVRSVGVALTLLALVVLGFVGYLYLVSGAQEARAQTILYARLRGELSQATAPTGPAIPGHPVSPASLAAVPGDPVALLSIPAIGVSNLVVVAGSSPADLKAGPGHLRDTPLPGQAGISVVFGRRALFGAPFGRLPALVKGDVISTTTSQGQARYQVIMMADSAGPVPFSSYPDQLLLVTADSGLAPAHYVEVEARLLNVTTAAAASTAPFPESGYLPPVSVAEVAFGRDPYALVPALAWAVALAAGAVTGSLLAARWNRWAAWIVAVPVLTAVLWNLYESLSALLPNLQ